MYWNRLRDSFDYLLAGGGYLLSRFQRQKMPSNLTPIQDIVNLSPLVCRIVGQNPGPYTLQGTNTYLVGSGREKILIDAGEANNSVYLEKLGDALGNSEISYIIATHWHYDHVGGISQVINKFVPDIKKVPIYKIRRTDDVPDKEPEKFTFIEDGHEVSVPGATLKIIAAPGHTMDHLVVHLREENSIFSGDCVLGERSSVFEDLHTYLKSLNLLQEMKPNRIYPGHGPTIDNVQEKLTEYISHRLKRESEIIDVLKKLKSSTAMTITSTIYKDIPLSVKIGAMGNVKHHLLKLIKDGKVVETSPGIYELIEANELNNFNQKSSL